MFIELTACYDPIEREKEPQMFWAYNVDQSTRLPSLHKHLAREPIKDRMSKIKAPFYLEIEPDGWQ